MTRRPLGIGGTAFVYRAACAFVILLASAPVRAADPEFKLFVPVNVKNLHPYVTSIEVLCSPKDANGIYLSYDIVHSLFDRTKPDATGSFSGTITSTMRMFAPADAAKVKGYSCILRLESNGSSRLPVDCPDPLSSWWCLKPGTARTLTVDGTIP
jgi:hypothetical protein